MNVEEIRDALEKVEGKRRVLVIDNEDNEGFIKNVSHNLVNDEIYFTFSFFTVGKQKD